ncbi:MAG: macro domain-containing protein [Phycisphaerae bacterium]|nr:macro domain-containing protein [Phycisphaerae bacterium]
MKTIHGDLIELALQGHFDVIVHGCNCFCSMGGGIARTIKAVFPATFEADCETIPGDKSKLGTCTAAQCPTDSGTVTVVNAYTQYDYAGPGVLVDYDALARCLQWVAKTYPAQRIGLPKIGAGLAGGDWRRIEPIIETTLGEIDCTLVIFRPCR